MSSLAPVDRIVPEGEWCNMLDVASWSAMRFAGGDIIEFEAELIEGFAGENEVGAMLVTGTDISTEGSLVVIGRSIGSTSEALTRKLGLLVNRGGRGLHLCWADPCGMMHAEDVIHTQRVRWFTRESFAAPYLKPWGRMVIKDYADIYEEGGAGKGEGRVTSTPKAAGEKPGAAGKNPKAKVKAAKDTGKKPPKTKEPNARPGKRKAGPEDPGEPRKGTPGTRRGGLDERLAKLRMALTGDGEHGEPEVIDLDSGLEEEEPYDHEDFAEEEAVAVKAEHWNRALVPVKREEGGSFLKKMKKVRKKKVTKDPSSQLLAIAAQAREDQEAKEKQKKKEREKGSGGAKALVKLLGALTGKKSSGSQKKKEKKKKGGDPGDSSEDSDLDEDTSSSESDLKAPLEKKSHKKPGAVLNMLIKHAKDTLDQSSVVETGEVEWRSQDEDLLQPDGETLSPGWIKGHEGDESSCSVPGRAAGGSPGSARRLPCKQIPRHPHGGQRRELEDSSIPRASPFGASPGCPDFPAPRGEEAWKDSEQKPGDRRMEKQQIRVGQMARRWKTRRREVKRKRKGKRRRKEGPGKLLVARRRLEQEQKELVERPEGEAGRERWKAGFQGRQEDVRGSGPEEGREGKNDDGPCFEGKMDDLRQIVNDARSMGECGVLLAWLAVRAGLGILSHSALSALFPVLGAGNWAVHQSSKRRIFPIRIGCLDKLVDILKATSYENAHDVMFVQKFAEDSWVLLSVLSCNSLYGSRDVPLGRWRRHEIVCVGSMRANVQRCLRLDCHVTISAHDVEKELSNRYVSYSGEEVPKMEPLSFDQILPALPPQTHGGAIKAIDWTRGKTRDFLMKPESCVVKDVGQKLPPLQAKVHIREGDRMKVAQLLVDRNICDWIETSSVLEFRGKKVLNGLFGVPKSSCLDDGRPHLRVIMNLIPSNSLILQLSGCVKDLPGITQYMSLIIDEGQEVTFCQSDMTSAFYLFSMPDEWKRFLSFGVHAKGEDIGRLPGREYTLSCRVLPMGGARPFRSCRKCLPSFWNLVA